jgi:acetyl-CoA carboxylase biotin carboxyl carrier protein
VNEAKLRQLLKLFEESDIEELELQHSFWRGTHIRISRRARQTPYPQHEAAAAAAHAAGGSPHFAGAAAPLAEPATEPLLHSVTSPMVGTFYRSSSPEADPFVREGDHVKIGQTLCVIEAMKIMNEIHAEVEGEVVEILVANGAPVEYNQPLIQLRSD